MAHRSSSSGYRRRRPNPRHLIPALIALSIGAAVLLIMFGPAAGSAAAQIDNAAQQSLPTSQETPIATEFADQVDAMTRALVRLPVATALAAVLALRPRRSGTPKRQPSVIQTQIILAIVGAIVMLVVGASLARAFGIVGAAGLIRYRAKVDDPKDAGVMLATLAIGLAAGVGQYLFAAFATVFVLGVLWTVESLEPEALDRFELTVSVKGGAEDLRLAAEQVLRRFGVEFELRGTSPDALMYEVKVPVKRHTERITLALARVAPGKEMDVKWEKKKDK
jgi:uncharacterized membrane protein YhiD involved in acid resistance